MRNIMHRVVRPQIRWVVREPRTNKAPLPPPPIPPDGDNPHHLYVAGDAGVASASLPFTSETGKIFVRMYGRNNAASMPNLTAVVTQNAVPSNLIKVAEVGDASVDRSICAAFGGTCTPNVAATLTFTLTGSMGRTWIRIGDFQDLPADWDDDVLYWENLSTQGGNPDNYYTEISPDPPANALMLSVVGWLDATAADIYGNCDYMQFTDSGGTGTAGCSAYFGEIDSPGGEPGWGGYVWYPTVGSQANRRPNALLIAIPGATLPS